MVIIKKIDNIVSEKNKELKQVVNEMFDVNIVKKLMCDLINYVLSVEE